MNVFYDSGSSRTKKGDDEHAIARNFQYNLVIRRKIYQNVDVAVKASPPRVKNDESGRPKYANTIAVPQNVNGTVSARCGCA